MITIIRFRPVLMHHVSKMASQLNRQTSGLLHLAYTHILVPAASSPLHMQCLWRDKTDLVPHLAHHELESITTIYIIIIIVIVISMQMVQAPANHQLLPPLIG